MKTTEDLFQKRLHAYTITHAIEDGNVLRFHVDYFKPEKGQKGTQARRRPSPNVPSSRPSSPSTTPPPADAASMPCSPPPPSMTPSNTTRCSRPCRRRNKPLIPISKPLNIACVFSPPAEGRCRCEADPGGPAAGIRRTTSKIPEKKKKRSSAILADYNARYGTNHRLTEFDLYYQDVQKRIKDQQWPNVDLRKALPRRPHQNRHHHRGGHAAHRLRFQIPEHALRGQEPPAPRLDPGLLPHQPRAQRHQALRQHPRLPPAAGRRGRRHRPLLRGKNRPAGPRNLAGGQGPRRSSRNWRPPCRSWTAS